MQKDLETLIYAINDNFLNFSQSWKENNSYKEINLKKKSVRSIVEKGDILEIIYAYRAFLAEKTLELDMLFRKNITCHSRVFTRLKTPNSIRDKISKYTNLKDEKGGVPICNCLNDILGIRIIQDTETDIEQIKKFLKMKDMKLKCIDSSKGLYKAVHVYFKNTNFDFPWELQIWKKEDEESNMDSHAKYKQEYTKWVAKGGNSGG